MKNHVDMGKSRNFGPDLPPGTSNLRPKSQQDINSSSNRSLQKIEMNDQNRMNAYALLPHAAAVLEGVRPALEGAVEVAVDLVLPLPALVHQRELEERPDVGAVAGQGDEDGDVRRAVLRVLPVGVEVDGPVVAPDGEDVAGDELAGPHPLGQRVAADGERVGAVHRPADRRRAALLVVVAGHDRSIHRLLPPV